MRTNPKPSVKKIKRDLARNAAKAGKHRTPNIELRTSNSRTGKRAEFLQSHPKEAAVESATVKKICSDIGDFRTLARQWGKDGFALVNMARDIGIFVNGFIQALPGGQLTLDFWLQFEGMFIDQHGHAISQDQLVWFAHHAQRNPEPVSDVNVMLSYRKEILSQVDLILAGERVGGNASPEAVNFYNKFFNLLDEKRLLPLVTGLESDPHYGPIRDWPLERKQRAWLQAEPFFKRLREIENELKPHEV